MRKTFLHIAAIALCSAALYGCAEVEGTEPGNDGQPKVTIYQYAPAPPMNPDETVQLRLANNGKVSEFYYLLELAATKDEFIKVSGRDAYISKVKSEGTKKSATSGDFEVLIEGLPNVYAISVVAVGNGMETMSEAVFQGIAWKDVITGTYTFNISAVSGTTPFTGNVATTLQISEGDETLYRFKDIFGEGFGMKVRLLTDKTATDDGGTYTYARIPVQTTGMKYTNTAGTDLGYLSVRDVGYWQGNDIWITENGYESGIYFDKEGKVTSAFLLPAWYVSTGTLGYNYDEFIPD